MSDSLNSSTSEEALTWTQKCKAALQNLAEPGVHKINWPVGGKAIVHSNKLDILLNVRVEVCYGHVFARDERGSTRDYKSYYMCASLREFYDFIYSRPTGARYFNEIIFGDWPCKAFFDLDVEKREEESVEAATARVNAMQDNLIARFKENVEIAFGKEITHVHVIVGDGYKADGATYKVSRHIVCDGVFFEDIYALGDFVRTYHASDVEVGLDLAIYNKNRAFRLVNCSKVRDSARVLYLTAPEEEVSFEQWSRLLVSAANADLDRLDEEDYPVVAVASSLEERERKRIRTSAYCRRVPTQAFQLPVALVHAQAVLNWIETPENGVFQLLEGTNGAFITEVRASPMSEDIIYINCSRCAHRDPCYVQRKTKACSQIVHDSQNTFSLVVNVRTGLIFVKCLSEQCPRAVRFEKDLPAEVLHNVASNRAMAVDLIEMELEAIERLGQDTVDQVAGEGSTETKCRASQEVPPALELEHELDESNLAVFFVEQFGSQFISEYNGSGSSTKYAYNGYIWQLNDDQAIMQEQLFSRLVPILQQHLEEVVEDEGRQKQLVRTIHQMSTHRGQLGLLRQIDIRIRRERVIFEVHPHLFAFTNGVKDLSQSGAPVVNVGPDTMLGMWTGYAWVQPTKEQVDRVRAFTAKIFPREGERKMTMMIFCSALYGITTQKFNIHIGEGRNGKSAFNGLALEAFGLYGQTIMANVLLDGSASTGPQPELANLQYKRLTIAREPDDRRKVNCTLLRDLTGGSVINARALYSNKTQVQLRHTMIMECNNKPSLSSTGVRADLERILITKFVASFVPASPGGVGDSKYRCDPDEYYTTQAFRTEHRCAFLQMLIEDYLDEFNAQNRRIEPFVPDYVRQATMSYMADSCDIITWFMDTFEMVEDDKEIISFGEDIYPLWVSARLKLPDDKVSLANSKSKLRKYLASNVTLKPFYKEFERRQEVLEAHGVSLKSKIRHVFMGFKIRDL